MDTVRYGCHYRGSNAKGRKGVSRAGAIHQKEGDGNGNQWIHGVLYIEQDGLFGPGGSNGKVRVEVGVCTLERVEDQLTRARLIRVSRDTDGAEAA
jgi:hypothetical protein